MNDEGLMADPNLQPAMAAIKYFLHRVQLDQNLRWYMRHTEAFHLMCAAYADFICEPTDEIKAKFSKLQPHIVDRPKVKIQRDALDKIQSLISDSRDFYLSREKYIALLEQIESVIGGAR